MFWTAEEAEDALGGGLFTGFFNGVIIWLFCKCKEWYEYAKPKKVFIRVYPGENYGN